MTARVWTGLTPMQADGLACVFCRRVYRGAGIAQVPVGWSRSGSQVFACAGGCTTTTAATTKDGA